METPVCIAARDGYALSAVLHESGIRKDPAVAALLCSGGGIPARVYRRFAAWLAARGVPALRFDYRGIGASRPATLRGFGATLEDWAERDCAAAIDWLRGRYPDAALAGVAHSIGALVLTGAPNASRIGRFLLVGAHTGYCGDYHALWRVPMTLMWHVLMPVFARAVGYFPGRALRMGEDLPSGFALQWAGRRRPEIEAEGMERLKSLEGRALALTFTDDGFATPRGTRRLLAHLPRLESEQRVIRPHEAGLARIGHFGFFRPPAERSLWPGAAEWLLAG
jgi:predicted alpha/beta hydrolase